VLFDHSELCLVKDSKMVSYAYWIVPFESLGPNPFPRFPLCAPNFETSTMLSLRVSPPKQSRFASSDEPPRTFCDPSSLRAARTSGGQGLFLHQTRETSVLSRPSAGVGHGPLHCTAPSPCDCVFFCPPNFGLNLLLHFPSKAPSSLLVCLSA